MEKQGNARHCFVSGVENHTGLGLSFYQPQPGQVVADVRIPAHFQGWNGVAHGGILAAMLDEAAGRAFLSGGALNRLLFTARLEIRYRKPVPIEQPLKLFGFAGDDRGKVVMGRSELRDEAGTLYAEAEAVMANIPDELLATMPSEPGEWQVYPDQKESDG
jgi:acyl-coenzyme A thioesterase PaaI-like protein